MKTLSIFSTLADWICLILHIMIVLIAINHLTSMNYLAGWHNNPKWGQIYEKKNSKFRFLTVFSIISSFISPPVYVGKEQATCEGDSNIVEGKVLHLWKLSSLHRHVKVKLSKVNITFISFPLNAFFCDLRSRSNSFIGLKAILYRLLEWYHPHTARRRFRGLLQVCLIFGPLHVSGWSFRISHVESVMLDG